jgi:hypothetical protein
MLVINIYVVMLAFGLAAGIAALQTSSQLPGVFTPVAGTMGALATLLLALRSTVLRIVDDVHYRIADDLH